jgi:hypothetical protein
MVRALEQRRRQVVFFPTIGYSDLTGAILVDTTSCGYDNAARETNLQFKDSSGNNISNFTYSYDPGSQLTNDGTWTYTYDSEGNLQKKSKGSLLETWTYGYDNLNHLVWAEDRQTDGGSLINRMDFKYDVFGDRIDQEVTANSTTTATHFAYDRFPSPGTPGEGWGEADAWADLSGSNVLQTRRLYVDAVDALFARISSGGSVAWYLTASPRLGARHRQQHDGRQHRPSRLRRLRQCDGVRVEQWRPLQVHRSRMGQGTPAAAQ